jgi:hypothetical protein
MRYWSAVFGFLMRHTSTWMVWLIKKMYHFDRWRIHVIHKKVYHASRITVWVAISSHGLIGPIFFEETVNSEHYFSMLPNTFVPQLLATGCRYKLSGSCRMEPGRTQRMLSWTFCITLSTRMSSQTYFLIVSHVERTPPE